MKAKRTLQGQFLVSNTCCQGVGLWPYSGVVDARVVLYIRQGCHLCTQARELVAAECEQAGTSYTEVDIDSDDTLRNRFSDFVPVVEVDGEHVGFWRIKPELVRGALASRG